MKIKDKKPIILAALSALGVRVRELEITAKFHHDCVYRYLGKHRLARDDWYDIVVFGYLHAVKMWFARPDLHKFQFSTIAYNCMRSSVGSELRKQKRRFEYRAVGLEENIPGTDGMTYIDILCDPRDCVEI